MKTNKLRVKKEHISENIHKFLPDADEDGMIEIHVSEKGHTIFTEHPKEWMAKYHAI